MKNALHSIAHLFSLVGVFVVGALLSMVVFAAPAQAADGVAMYRLYNPYTGEHFYTASVSECTSVVAAGWNFEGIGWYAPSSGDPVYRLYNKYAGDHHYTTSTTERDYLVKVGWTYENVGWYSDTSKKVALYRQYNPYVRIGTHNYTTSKSENDSLVKIGWRAEGVGWYAVAGGDPNASISTAASPSSAGKLRVQGTQLVSESGKPVQLKGVSTHGLAWYPQYVNQSFFTQLHNGWNANVVRLAMYTAEYGGYCTGGNKSELMNLIDKGVTYATNADLYVIIDWHVLNDKNPLVYKDQAVEFFKTVSAKYKNNKNVIYEICNEPNSGASWSDIKTYANAVIPAIRANDPNALILVGTPTWSQDVDQAAARPLNYSNVMYTMHFYAATHKDDLRNKLKSAVSAGLPVFVSEFGICDASGNGGLDYASANQWVSLMDSLNVSYVCWNLSNKNESSALFKTSCNKTSGFLTSDLSDEGKWLWGVLH